MKKALRLDFILKFGRRANEIGTASNSAEKKGSPSEGVAEEGGWGEEFRHARAEAKRFRFRFFR